jgi:hypothetical protein
MTQLLRIVFQLSWGLGVLSILAGVVVKYLSLELRLHVNAHTLFLVACTFFLCTLATREMGRSTASP